MMCLNYGADAVYLAGRRFGMRAAAEHVFNAEDEEIEDTRHAMMEIHMCLPAYAPRYSILRKRR